MPLLLGMGFPCKIPEFYLFVNHFFLSVVNIKQLISSFSESEEI